MADSSKKAGAGAVMLDHVYAIIARLMPQEELAAEIEARLGELARLALEADGAVDYRVHRADDGALLVFETYPTPAARAAHLDQPAVAAFLAELPRLLAAEPRVELATQLSPANQP